VGESGLEAEGGDVIEELSAGMDNVTEMVPIDISHAWVFGIVEFTDVY
jgi:hypothetical protein